MIDARELIIGNKIASGVEFKETSIIGTVLEIGNLEREFEQIYCECEESFEWFFKDNYCGIPLTEEWLIRFGLERKNGYPYKYLDGYIKIRNGQYFFKYYQLEIELPYVHTFQNLAYALTGTELTLK